MREHRFTKVDRKQSYKLFQQWIDNHNKKHKDDPKLIIRAGRDRTLNYLSKTYLDQVDAGLAVEGFFETSISLVANTIHMSPKTVSRHLEVLVSLGFLNRYDHAGAATNTGHASNIKVSIPYDWVRMLDKPVQGPDPSPSPSNGQGQTSAASPSTSIVAHATALNRTPRLSNTTPTTRLSFDDQVAVHIGNVINLGPNRPHAPPNQPKPGDR